MLYKVNEQASCLKLLNFFGVIGLEKNVSLLSNFNKERRNERNKLYNDELVEQGYGVSYDQVKSKFLGWFVTKEAYYLP